MSQPDRPASDAAKLHEAVLAAIYAMRRDCFRNADRIRISEPTLRKMAEDAGVYLPKGDDGETLPLVEPMTLYGVPVKLDDSQEGFVVE